MDMILAVFGNMFSDGNTMLMALLIFLAAGTLAFSVMAALRVRGAVKKRTSRILSEQERASQGRSLQGSSAKALTKLIDYTTKHYSETNQEHMKVLRRRLVQAGIYDPRGVAFFFIGRTALAIGVAAAIFIFLPLMKPVGGSMFWLLIVAGGVAGYAGPSMYVDRRISARTLQHRSGFPDFMDLLVVCADSGLSLEASFERVGREIGQGYPSLSANIHLTNLEIRAGRGLKEALENFADRLALEEARAFATLINQSIDLGSSITDAMRVYSDDMRHKRLSRAEEKAYALPAKLAVPMMVCIFPVLFVVILCPVIVRMVTGTWCARPPRQTRHGPARGLPSRSSPSLARPVLSGRWPGRPIRAWGGGIRAGGGPERVMSIRVARILIVGAACLTSACSTAPKLSDDTTGAVQKDGGVTGILS